MNSRQHSTIPDAIRFVRRLPATAIAIIGWLVIQGQISLPARAQSASATWQSTVDSLSGSNGQLSSVTVPSEVLTGDPGSATWQISKASVLLFAADAAKHKQFPIRTNQLLQEAINSLVAAQNTGLPASLGSQCANLLGTLAERVQNNLTAAASYYEQALALDPSNSQAARSLARVNLYIARAHS